MIVSAIEEQYYELEGIEIYMFHFDIAIWTKFSCFKSNVDSSI
jgi:hypothetical protein